MGLPFSIMLVAFCYIVLVKWMFPCHDIKFTTSANLIHTEVKKLGSLSKEEKRVLTIFAITVSLWITRTLINTIFPGLGLTDTMISMFGAICLFAIPLNLKKGTFVLEWSDTSKLAWGILLLFGGGLALAKGMASSGLVDAITQVIKDGNFPVFLTVSFLIVLMLFMTELMSNVALVAVLAPVVAGIAIGLGIPMLYVLIPVTMASSCAFMLPMATPPNAIVFASGYVKVNQMARAGIILNCIAVVLLIFFYQFIIPIFF